MILKYFSWNKKTDLFLNLTKNINISTEIYFKDQISFNPLFSGSKTTPKNKDISYESKCQSGPVCIDDCVYKMYVW